ncbi:MAG: YfcE family phosphodiesterase [Promethearchaeota archaeon]
MKLLIIGDFHVPDRAPEIPISLLNLVNENARYDAVACTGDLTKVKIIEPILNLWSDRKYVVLGNMDYYSRNTKYFPREQVFSTENDIADRTPIKIGVVHGHDIHPRGELEKLAVKSDKLNVDVLISGHTHALSVDLVSTPKGRTVLLINPGSATGAWSFVASMKPSFIIMHAKAVKGGVEIKLKCFELDKYNDLIEELTFLHDGNSISRVN